MRRGDVGLDIVAALSMLAALVFAEYLAAVVVAGNVRRSSMILRPAAAKASAMKRIRTC